MVFEEDLNMVYRRNGSVFIGVRIGEPSHPE
jgi:hypothetical protein